MIDSGDDFDFFDGPRKRYDYKFVEVKKQAGAIGASFEECKKVIMDEAEKGWRLIQVVGPINEKAGINR